MREIMFRAKSKEDGEWVYGGYFKARGYLSGETLHFIAPKECESLPHGEFDFAIEVAPETLGQYTGLTDKNGTKIFEGDLVRLVRRKTGELSKYVYEVFWDDDYVGFRMFFHKTGYREEFDGVPHWYVVVGNIHDNPELLKGE